MVPRKKIHLICYVILTVLPWTRSELFTAIAEVEPLLETHQRIIDNLDHYIRIEEQRLVVLRTHLNQYKKEQEKAMEDIPNYLGNPINAFKLIKRLTTDLDSIEHSIKNGTGGELRPAVKTTSDSVPILGDPKLEDLSTERGARVHGNHPGVGEMKEFMKNVTINRKDVKYPTAGDLAGAAHALIRLQEMYQLNTTDLANGMLNGFVYSSPMTTSDCFELARALYTDKAYTHSLPWFMETLRKYKKEEMNYFSEVDVLEYISYIHYLKDDVKSALEWTLKILKVEPDHPRARVNILHHKESIKEKEANRKKRQRGETLEEVPEEKNKDKIKEYDYDRKQYERLCRGEMELPAFYSKNLHCRYLAENHPFLKLAPIKMEYVYRNPDVIVFHEVINDDEIEFVKKQSLPRFQRAVVQNPKTGVIVHAQYRISKSAWLLDEESPVIAAISRRVAHMTGLSMASAEDLQVVNYGIGGHYEPHFDFWTSFESMYKKFKGNRIATVMFYMSEVPQGGATVFTRLGISVFPIKGAALFWMNLHPSGEGDVSTRHAGCPVLSGSKWVSNKWLHQSGQELLRPCGLRYQSEDYLHNVPRALHKTQR